MGAARDQVSVDLVRGRRSLVRHIAPAAIVVVAVGELDRPGAVRRRASISAPRASSSSMSRICRVITAQWIGWFDRASPACTGDGFSSKSRGLGQVSLPDRRRNHFAR